MPITSPLLLDPVILAQALVDRVRDLLHAGPPPDPEVSDIPGGPLAFAAGHLHLLSDERARDELQTTLWPEVRRWYRTPARAVAGSYRFCLERAGTFGMANALPMPLGEASGLEPRLARVLSEPHPVSTPRPPPFTELPTPARAPLILPELGLSLLRERLEAGFLMVAVEALWPSRAAPLQRILWHDAGLQAWDATLQGLHGAFEPLAPRLRAMLAQTAAPLDARLFAPLIALARDPENSAAEAAPQLDLSPVTGLLLAEHILRHEHPDAWARGTCRVWEQAGRVLIELVEDGVRFELVRREHDEGETARLVPVSNA